MAQKKLFRFLITPDGTLGAEYRSTPAALQRAELIPGAALAEALANDVEDEDWDGDVPDVSADFARIAHPEANGESAAPAEPLTADFTTAEDGSITLLRWPRLARPAVVPKYVAGHPVTQIAATAFAPIHIPPEQFDGFYVSPISFSIFCMRMGRFSTQEAFDEGGPTGIFLPDTVRHIGPYAFYRCSNLKQLTLPEGITELPAGCFGECRTLKQIYLPDSLQIIGWLPRPTNQAMPDVGVFAGCHSLTEITLPATFLQLGAHTFNSAGLVQLSIIDGPDVSWSRKVTVDSTAFAHTAALLWLEKCTPDGHTLYTLALPPARDKILADDPQFGQLIQIPQNFFAFSPEYFDTLAQHAFRLDFSARMALARLRSPASLSEEMQQWYTELLVSYFDRSPQFMPNTAGEAAYTELFNFLQTLPNLTASQLSSLLRTAGQLGLSAELLSRMFALRTQRFSTVTGFEDLELG